MSNSIVVRKHGMNDAEKDIYMSKGYFGQTLIKVKEAVKNKTLDEIRAACRILKENNHINYEEYPVDVTLTKIEILPAGEDAYNSEFYLELNKKDSVERKITWPQKYWWVVLLIGAIVGFGIDELKTHISEASLKSEAIQLQPSTPTLTDSLKNSKPH